MGTTTLRTEMRFLDRVLNNAFLQTLFPTGIDESVCVGHFALEADGDFTLHLHVNQKPALETLKWGKWGKDYDTIIMIFRGTQIADVLIRSWTATDYQPIHCQSCDDYLRFESISENCEIQLSFKTLTFQRCQTYMA